MAVNRHAHRNDRLESSYNYLPRSLNIPLFLTFLATSSSQSLFGVCGRMNNHGSGDVQMKEIAVVDPSMDITNINNCNFFNRSNE
jgi:hypothetical protein